MTLSTVSSVTSVVNIGFKEYLTYHNEKSMSEIILEYTVYFILYSFTGEKGIRAPHFTHIK